MVKAKTAQYPVLLLGAEGTGKREGNETVNRMKKIGIIGGIGPESTLLYYRGIIEAFREDYGKTGFPPMVIESLDLKTTIDLVQQGKWDSVSNLIALHCEQLKEAGAAFGIIASNTPHRVFTDIRRKTTLELISIVDVTGEHCVASGLKRPLLIGTLFTMQADFYTVQLNRRGVTVSVPQQEEQEFIQQKLFSEIEMGIIKDETRLALNALITHAASACACDSIILGCTELPLILRQEDFSLPLIDTAALHIRAAVRKVTA